jgi:hypothetical protein
MSLKRQWPYDGEDDYQATVWLRLASSSLH